LTQDWKMLIYFMAIWNILQTSGIFYDHLIHFVFIWYIFPVWVIFAKKNLVTLIHSFYIKRRWCSTLGVNKGVNIPLRGHSSPMGARGKIFKINVQRPVFNFTPRGKI
jgi:hypothetical protein